MKNEIIKLRNADVGGQVSTIDFDGNPIIVGVDAIPNFWGRTGVCPCLTCAFGDWKTRKVEVSEYWMTGRATEVFEYDIRCPMFEACNAKDRPDRKSVKFTKAQTL